MAHAQASHESNEAYYRKHKNQGAEIMKAAIEVVTKLCDENGNKDKAKEARITGCRIHNNAKGESLKLHAKHDWSGSGQFVSPYSDSIPKGRTGDLVHFDCTNCDEAAVVYADGGGLGWLLAWSVGGHAAFGGVNPNKVYVEVGPIGNYKKIEWNTIKAKLVASRDICSNTYENTGCMAFAIASPGKKATVIATFNAMSLL